MDIIDIHCHITPGVDDGAKDRETSRSMLSLSKQQGVTDIILTPHYNERRGMITDPREGFTRAKEEAKTLGIRLYTGNEIYYSRGAMEQLHAGALYTLAGTGYVLAEFSFTAEFEAIRRGLSELINAGFQPVVAHVERYSSVYQSDIYELLELGAYLQLNANSVMAGSFQVKRFCKRLLKENLVSFIASDCHNMAERKPNLGDCATYIEKKYGGDVCEKIFSRNPRLLIDGKDIIV